MTATDGDTCENGAADHVDPLAEDNALPAPQPNKNKKSRRTRRTKHATYGKIAEPDDATTAKTMTSSGAQQHSMGLCAHYEPWICVVIATPVSYTHLTLPTILLV